MMIRAFVLTSITVAAVTFSTVLKAADDNTHADSTGNSAVAKDAQDKTDKADVEKLTALFNKLDANHDGLITSDEVPDDQRRLFERLLRRADHNGDGKLSLEEFLTGMKDMEDRPDRPADRSGDGGGRPNNGPGGGAPPAGGFGNGFGGGGFGGGGPLMGIALFRALDTNGDGKLDTKEIAAAPDVLKKLANSNGEITREELLKSMPGGGGFGGGFGGGGAGSFGGAGQGAPNPDAMFKRIMQQLDKNGDGKLQKDELPPRLQEHFDELDTNHDGVLDESEIKAILPRLLRRMQDDGGAANGGAGAKAQDRPLRRLQSETKALADKMIADDKKTDKADDKEDKSEQKSDKTDGK